MSPNYSHWSSWSSMAYQFLFGRFAPSEIPAIAAVADEEEKGGQDPAHSRQAERWHARSGLGSLVLNCRMSGLCVSLQGITGPGADRVG